MNQTTASRTNRILSQRKLVATLTARQGQVQRRQVTQFEPSGSGQGMSALVEPTAGDAALARAVDAQVSSTWGDVLIYSMQAIFVLYLVVCTEYYLVVYSSVRGWAFFLEAPEREVHTKYSIYKCGLFLSRLSLLFGCRGCVMVMLASHSPQLPLQQQTNHKQGCTQGCGLWLVCPGS